jgi:hypothetical protein
LLPGLFCPGFSLNSNSPPPRFSSKLAGLF